MILGNVISNLRNVRKIMFLRYIWNKSKKWTGFADDNGFAYFCRNKSRSSRRLIL